MTKKAYFIIGAVGGIGEALSDRLHDQGHIVIGTSRSEDAAASFGDGASRLGMSLDASDFKATTEAVKEAASWAESMGAPLAGGINCAGSVMLKPAHLTSRAEFDAVMEANVATAFSLVRAITPVLRKQGGSIVLMSSAAATLGLSNHEGIAAAKGAVVGLTLSAAATYAAQGIRVNAVAPGLVDTPMTAGITGHAGMMEASRELHPLGRTGQVQDVVPCLQWLLSDESSWVTGQVIGVDGGLASTKARAAKRAPKEVSHAS
ncbi:MAG: SDR family NAD(P)-dependent oxidoreductase [Phycisphaerae bacterium]